MKSSLSLQPKPIAAIGSINQPIQENVIVFESKGSREKRAEYLDLPPLKQKKSTNIKLQPLFMDGILILMLTGSLSLKESLKAKDDMTSLFEEEEFDKIVVNFKQIEKTDWNSIGWMVWVYRACQQLQKKIVFCELNQRGPCVNKLLDINPYLKVYSTENQALAIFQ